MTFATAERSFSIRCKTYLRQMMSQKRLNVCMVLDIHKDRADAPAIIDIAKSLVNDLPERMIYLGRCDSTTSCQQLGRGSCACPFQYRPSWLLTAVSFFDLHI